MYFTGNTVYFSALQIGWVSGVFSYSYCWIFRRYFYQCVCVVWVAVRVFLSAWFLRHFNSARIIYCREYTNTLTPAPMDSARHRSQATGPHTRLVIITFANVFPDENKPIDCWLRWNVMKTRFSLEEITIFNKFLVKVFIFSFSSPHCIARHNRQGGGGWRP